MLVGANASGKSNFIGIFRFLKNILENGLDNAISMQGGVEYIRNINIGSSQNLTIQIQGHSDLNRLGWPVRFLNAPRKTACLSLQNISYLFDIKFLGKKSYKIQVERLETSAKVYEYILRKSLNDLPTRGKLLGEGKIILNRNEKGEITHEANFENMELDMERLWMHYPLRRFSPKELVFVGKPAVTSAITTPLSFELGDIIDEIAIYDIDPRNSRRPAIFSGKTDLESDGSNLAIVLKRILENSKSRKKFFTLMNEILPFVEDITVKNFVDKSFIPCLKESYCDKQFLPTPWISDGTISIIALIVALFYGTNKFIVFEEPERNIHPALTSKLISLMKDTAKRMKKQVIITTHNPQIVKYAGIDSLIVVHREKNYSCVSRPALKEEVQLFMKNDLGVDELFIRNLLE